MKKAKKKTAKKDEPHTMNISTMYDTERDIMWTWLDGVYQWSDGKYTHKYCMASKLRTIRDLMTSWRKSLERVLE